MPNDKNGQFLKQVRSWFSDFRLEVNTLIDGYQKRLDELELRLSKETIVEPTVRVDDGEVFEISMSGKPEKRN